MRFTQLLLAGALALGLAAPAFAAGKGGALTAGGRTISGPGTVALGTGTQVRVHDDPTVNRDVCVTVANTGRSQVTLALTGDTTPSTTIEAGFTKALCVANVHFVDVSCTGVGDCTAQWRVDQD